MIDYNTPLYTLAEVRRWLRCVTKTVPAASTIRRHVTHAGLLTFFDLCGLMAQESDNVITFIRERIDFFTTISRPPRLSPVRLRPMDGVSIDPRVCCGRPCIEGTRVWTSLAYHWGGDFQRDYDVTPEQAAAAQRFERVIRGEEQP